MKFVNTRKSEKVTGAQAIVQCIASNGGLFVPESFPKIAQEEFVQMAEMSYAERTAFLLGKYLGDELGKDFLLKACEDAYAKFTSADPVPLVKVDEGFYMLELFHGPTCSVKDLSMRLMPALLKRSMQIVGVKEDAFLFTPTTGDTGKAAMEAFRDVEGVKVAVVYPDESVVKMQRLQLSVQDGENVFAAGLENSFDECQRLVRDLFADEAFTAELKEKNLRLMNVTSLNIGRILPQIAYYFSAYIDLQTSGKVEANEEVDFILPVSNFGGAIAGWYAKQMGLPIRKLVCASNRNHSLSELFRSGKFDAKRNLLRTMSPSMDVLAAANVERLVFELSGRDTKATAQRMKDFASKKEYNLTCEEKKRLDADFAGGYASEDDTVEAMYEIFDEYGYAMDTHTGVALSVFFDYAEKKDKKDYTQTVVLSVANPYKFPQDVLYALSGNDVKDSFKGVKRLNLLTAMKPPKSLVDLRYRPLRFKKSYPKDGKKLMAAVMEFASGVVIPVPDASSAGEISKK